MVNEGRSPDVGPLSNGKVESRREFLKHSSAAVAFSVLPGLITPGTNVAPGPACLTVGNRFLEVAFRSHQRRLRPDVLANYVTGQSLSLIQAEGFVLWLGEPDPDAPRETKRAVLGVGPKEPV